VREIHRESQRSKDREVLLHDPAMGRIEMTQTRSLLENRTQVLITQYQCRQAAARAVDDKYLLGISHGTVKDE
jgi:predicted double-glycine peptidase